MSGDTSAVERMIKAAIDGGYSRNGIRFDLDYYTRDSYEIYRLLLDPEFFKCAGKTLGWRDGAVCRKCFLKGFSARPDKCDECIKNIWLSKQLTFMTHLADGHDINSAIENIL